MCIAAQQDANFNVTSIVGDDDAVTSGTQWGVVERYAYDAYGEPTFMDASFTALSGNVSAYAWTPLSQGTMFDPNADLYHVRYRVLKDGRWAQQDPVPYIDGSNRYQVDTASPEEFIDSLGLAPDPDWHIPVVPPDQVRLPEGLDSGEEYAILLLLKTEAERRRDWHYDVGNPDSKYPRKDDQTPPRSPEYHDQAAAYWDDIAKQYAKLLSMTWQEVNKLLQQNYTPTNGLRGRLLSPEEKSEFDAFKARAEKLGLTENPNRTGSFGKMVNGKWKEIARIDVAEAGKAGWRGKTHIHIEGIDDHLDPSTPLPGE